MAKNLEHFSELHRKNMEAAMRLAQLSIDNSQRIMALQTDLAKALFDESVSNARAQSSAKDPQEIMRLRAAYAQETAQRMVAAAQKVAEIGNDTRIEFTRLLSEQLATGNHDLTESMQNFFKSLPGQTPNVMESFQQAIQTANAALQQIAQASSAAFTGAGEAVKKATKGK